MNYAQYFINFVKLLIYHNMKRISLIIAFIPICIAIHAQQLLPNEFFGLKFDEVYTLNQMIEHIGSNGTFIQETEPFQMGTTTYYGCLFENVTYNAQHYPSMMLMSLKHGTFGGVTFTFTNENICKDQSLTDIYNTLKDSLTTKYGDLSDIPIDGQPENISRLLNIGNGVALRLDKYTANDTIMAVEISYVSLIAAMTDNYIGAYPTIQDTFLGLKLGTEQTSYSIRLSVGHKGEYLNEKYDPFGKSISFTNFIFAGKTWDYGNFSLTDKGELYKVSAYDSLDEKYEDELNAADQIYELYKSNLDVKYGVHEEHESDTGKYVIYVGNNNIAIILSNECNESAGGEYRRYIKIEYYQTTIFKQLSNSGFEEL